MTDQSNQSRYNQRIIVQKTQQFLEKELDSDPDIETIELEFMELENIHPLIQLLRKFGMLKKLSLHGNRIKQLPEDLATLKQLEELDISNNMIYDVRETIAVLKRLPNLRLLVSSFKGSDEELIKQSLQQLQFYNNSKIQKQTKPPEIKKSNKYQLKNEHLQKAAKMFDEVRAIYKKLYSKNNDKALKVQFQQDTHQNMTNMHNIISENKNSPDNILSGIFLNSRYSLFKLIEAKLINLVTDVEPQFGKLLGQLLEEYALIVSYFSQVTISKAITNQNNNHKNANQNTVAALEKQVKRVRRQKQQLLSEISILEDQNKSYIDALVKYSKGQRITVVNNFKSSRSAYSPSRKSQATDRSRVNKNNSKDYVYLSSTSKNLTLKQLKDFIIQIQQSKIKFDQKLSGIKLPRQTMYKYLFTFLNQKYGLKSLTIEWASSIVAGIQKYSSDDNDVAVFGKVLRNQCEQEFQQVQTQAKSAVSQLLKMHIKSRLPYKTEADIKQILDEEMNHEITSEQAQDIIKYFYNQSDAQQILSKLSVLYTIPTRSDKKYTRQQSHVVDKKTIKYLTFLKTILDMQLKSHQKYIKPLTQAFHAIDTDNDGVINQKQFSDLLEDMCQHAQKYLLQFLNIVDPYQTKLITYSQVVKLFSNFPEGNPILSRFADSH